MAQTSLLEIFEKQATCGALYLLTKAIIFFWQKIVFSFCN